MFYSNDIVPRCRKFAVRIINCVCRINQKTVVFSIGKQIIDSASSVGANMMEARHARTAKEFLSCASISLREINETIYWLDLFNDLHLISPIQYDSFYQEANAIARIIQAIIKNYRKSSNLIS